MGAGREGPRSSGEGAAQIPTVGGSLSGPGTGALRVRPLPSPQPGLVWPIPVRAAAEEAGVPSPLPLGSLGTRWRRLFNPSPPACILSWSPGPATVFTLSPVYFASSAHTAFADTGSAVGWENVFLLSFCRKCSWLRGGYREVLGFQAPVQRAWVGRGPPPPNTPFHRVLARNALQLGTPTTPAAPDPTP